MALSNSQKATLKHLAAAGDMTAKALVDGVKDMVLSAAAEVADSIKVTGQMVDGAGNPLMGVQNVLVQSVPVSGTGLLTDGGAGVAKAGSGSTSMWFETDATGKFQVDVANAVAEQNLVQVTTDNGDVAQIVLTFA